MNDFAEIQAAVELRKKVARLKRLEQLRQENGLAFYEPHEKQRLFHSYGDWKYRYVRTGNRFGKSDMGAAEDVAWAVGARLWLSPEHEDYQKGIPSRPTKGLIVTIDWDKATEIFTNEEDGIGRGKLLKFCPKERLVRTSRNHSGAIDKLVIESMHGGQSTIYLDTVKSFLQNQMSQESSNWDWVHIDEPCPEAMWKAISRGLADVDGKAWMACTPLSEPWMNDFFIPSFTTKLDEGRATEFETEDEDGDRVGKVVIVGSMFDNPYLSKKGVKAYAETLDADEKECRLYGKPLAMAGMVYKQFDHNRHIYNEVPHGWEEMFDPPEDYTIRYAIDPHAKTPHAVLFAATSPQGYVFFFDEIFDNSVIEGLCDMIHNKIEGRFVARAVCDPIAYIEDPITKLCWADVFMEHGIFFDKATKDLTGGIRMTQSALKREKYLFFGQHLQRTIWEFEHYVWDPKKPEKPRDKDDHMMECLYRLVLGGLDYVKPPKGEGLYFPQAEVGYVEIDKKGLIVEKAEKNVFDFETRYPRG